MTRMTLHIDEHMRHTIRIEGRLDSASIDEFKGLMNRRTPEGTVTIDLSGVRSIDAAARAVLIGLSRAGHQVIGASLYIKELLKEDSR